MATENIVEEIRESFLSCAICVQPFNRPKALPCLHTFCEDCLKEYVASRFDSTDQVPCPICRQTIYLTPGDISSLPDNYFVVGLNDTVTTFITASETVQHEKSPLLYRSKSDINVPVNSNQIIRRFGEYGSLPHQFVHVTGITTCPFTDDIILADTHLNRISIFSSTGQFKSVFQCDCSIRDIEMTRNGAILVTVSQAGSSLLREYDTKGKLLASYGSFYSNENPFGLTLSRLDKAIVTGLRQNCIHVLTERRKPSIRFGSRGRSLSQFSSPYYVTVNSRDDIIVADSGNHRIKIHKMDGRLICAFGKQGSKAGELVYPMGVCVDRFDNVYVADANNYRVQVFSSDGQSLGFPVQCTYEYGIDVKPVNVKFMHDNVLLVVLRGSKFCQVQSYLCDAERYRPIKKSSWLAIGLFSCCK